MMMLLNGGQRYSFGLFATLMGMMAFTASFAGCTDQAKEIPAPVIMPDSTHHDTTGSSTNMLSYMALGDSYTIGQSVVEEARYPVQAAAMLSTGGLAVARPAIIATSGWTTQDLLTAIANANPAKDYDIVSLLIGVNDQYQRHDTSGYRQKFTDCLTKAIEIANYKTDHVFVLSIPDYGVTPFGQGMNPAEIGTQIDQFNAINKSVTMAYGISYTDVTVTSRAVKDDPQMVAGDGLHPSGSQYKLWAALLAADIKKKYP